MPALLKNQATDKLALAVEKAKPPVLSEVYTELFPEKIAPAHPSASELAEHIRKDLETDELVDLWNVVFPEDRNVWYDDEEKKIHYNEEVVGYADMD